MGKKRGLPYASIRVLVNMSVLMEGNGCSDEDLFNKCESDLLTRKTLGLELLIDVTPSIEPIICIIAASANMRKPMGDGSCKFNSKASGLIYFTRNVVIVNTESQNL